MHLTIPTPLDLPAIRILPPDPRPSLFFDTEGRECDARSRAVCYRADPDGWIMEYSDRLPADEPTYGWRAREMMDVMERVCAAMRARGYVPRP